MTMKLAHLLLVHSIEPQLERLLRRLQHANADIYIHVDKKADMGTFEILKNIPSVYFIRTRTSVDWGNFNMVEATLRSFQEIINTGKQYSHINLLSAQDYPLKTADQIQQFLFANANKTYIRWISIPDEWDEPMGRLTKYNLGDYHIPAKYYLQNLANKFLPPRKWPAGLKMYGRSQWLTITPQCAQYVIDYLQQNKTVNTFFKQTWACDELVFQTVLLNSPFKDMLVNDHLRFIKFKRGDSRPQTLTIANVDELIKSGKFYARKFDKNIDTRILDELDKLNDQTSTLKTIS